MENRQFIEMESCSANSLTELQKEDIRKAILQSVAIIPYYKGLELDACKAISNINKYSDAEVISEILNEQTGERYVKKV
ncbi:MULTISPECIES: hypothetical protein [Gallibacterium]|uniref:Uncharacterized protein n=1 Tax=Gallibacterium genomosp. 1 TaxID=155515 RepID=A0AB36DVH2_9PAST|nr:hypothetical protein [Gallibacterium genomosp. 1]OBX00462.1 hypothetical protein QV05_07685 [Gallibacterium genomosp. 1]